MTFLLSTTVLVLMSDWEIAIQVSLCVVLLVSSRWAGSLVRFLGENVELTQNKMSHPMCR